MQQKQNLRKFFLLPNQNSKKLYGQYGNEAFFKSVVRDLNSCRTLLFEEFILRFQEMKIEIMLTTLLNPRLRLNSKHWKNDAEKNLVEKLLITSVERIAVQEASAKYRSHTSKLKSIEIKTKSKSGKKNKIASNCFEEHGVFFSENEHAIDLYGENDTIVNEILSESKTLEKAKYQAKQEVLSYLIATEECIDPKSEIDPLEWW